MAYKSLIGAKRSEWRVLSAIEQKVDGFSNQLARQYQERVAAEIKAVCSEALELIQKHLEPHATQAESKLFYAKMTGDYYRYLSEIIPSCDEQQRQYSDASKAAYDKATSLSRTGLPPTHPIRLGLALSFAVFSYEILKDHERAIQIAKAAFDEAISDLDSLSENYYKDTTLILQLLRDNLTQWTLSNTDGTSDSTSPIVYAVSVFYITSSLMP